MPTSSLVPHVWPLAINGVEYAIDDGSQVYEDRSIPTLRNVATGGTADETTLNPERGFLRSFTSFKRGAGQTFRDADDSDDKRFRDSWHVDVFSSDVIAKPTVQVEKVAATITVAQPPVVLGRSSEVFVAEDANIHKFSPTAGTPSVTTLATGGAAISTLVDQVPSASYLLAQSASQIWYVPSTLASNTDRTPTGMSAMNGLMYGHGTFLTAGTVTSTPGIYELSGDPTTSSFTATLVHGTTIAGASRYTVGIVPANGGFFYADYAGEIHYISVDNAGTLTYEGVRAKLDNNELIGAIYEHLGFIFILLDPASPTRGLRMCTQDTSGNLTVGALIDDFVPSYGMAFRGQKAYVTVDTAQVANRLDATIDPIGVVEMDLTQINDGLVPAWAFGSMYDGSGDSFTASAVSVAAGRTSGRDWLVFASTDHVFRTRHAGLGAYQDTDGWLSTGWVSWGIGDNKLLQEVTLDADDITVSYSTPSDVDTYTAYTNGDEASDVAIDLKFNVGATTAEFRRATARAYPQTTPQREVSIPILLGEQVTDLRNVVHKRDPRAERDALVALEGTVVDLQEGQATSVRALVTGHRWVGLNRESLGTFGGTLILDAKLL